MSSDPKTIVRWVVWHPMDTGAFSSGMSAEAAQRVAVYRTRLIVRGTEDAEQAWRTMAAHGWRCTRIEEPANE